MENLYVFYRATRVGTIEYNPLLKEYSFTYDSQWIQTGFELTPVLKFSGFDHTAFKLFVENLLPEGESLTDLSKYFAISKANKFALLKKIGLDTTGALMFLSDSTYSVETSFREISKEELKQRVESKDTEPLSIWDKKLRLSVAGVQEKLPISYIDNKMGFAEGELCSTHILKFNKRGENVILNEYISLKLSEAIGLNTASVEYKTIGSEKVLYVLRFDRTIIDTQHIERTHVIDSVQALGLPVEYKYERVYGAEESVKDFREGVSWSKLFDLSVHAKTPLLFKEQLILWNILNLCLGNSDAHGKNISFFVTNEGLEIAPFYDVVNITMYNGRYEQDMAMAIDDEFSYDISVFSFQTFLEDNHISKTQYFEYFKGMVKKIGKAFNNFDFVENSIYEDEKEFCTAYKLNVRNRVNALVDIINELRYPKKLNEESNEEFYTSYADDIRKVLNIRKKDDSNALDVDKLVNSYRIKVEEKCIKKI